MVLLNCTNLLKLLLIELFLFIQSLEEEIKGGTTAVVALIHRGILYVGNIGDSRALLCQKDKYVISIFLGAFE